ncbi:MAG: FAD-binding oxidoreductase, partial [Desulfobacula sp.]|nr:FAD-binding oxidoreductase [Desulfobacula sp.]
METNKDIIIIGGGIIGLACAHYLLQQNASVRIIEQDIIESGASSKNCGVMHFGGVIPLCKPGVILHEIVQTICRKSALYIKPNFDIALIKWLFKFACNCNLTHMNAASRAKNNILQYSLDLFDLLFKEHSFRCDFKQKGLLLLFKDKKYFEKYNHTNIFLKNYGFNIKRYEQNQVRVLEPAAKKEIIGAWYDEHDWHLRPGMLVKAWKKLLIDKGLIIEEKCKLMDFGIHQNKIKHVNTIKGQFKADHFILAAGAWTSKISRQLKLNIPVQPGKGYSITMEKPDFSPEIPCMLYEKNMVVTPWENG